MRFRGTSAFFYPSPQIQFLEEIVALVVDHDEGGEILHLDFPDRLHAEFRIFHRFDLLDAMLGEICRRATDRGKIKAAVLLAGFAHRGGAVALGQQRSSSSRKTPSRVILPSACRSAAHETPSPMGSEAPCLGSRITRTS